MKNVRINFLLALATMLVLAFCGIVAQAQSTDYSKKTVSELVDELAEIDSPAPGICSTAIYVGFIVDNRPGEFQVGVLGTPAPKVPPQMSELVRRGPRALPALIKHLDDTRPTKLDINGTESNPQGGMGFFTLSYFGNEYDPRVRHTRTENDSLSEKEREKLTNEFLTRMEEKQFRGRYRVKIGDVCFALIGQIVNRRLLAVRYQPSAILVVNSPIETPELVRNIRDDWKQGDPELLKASLLSDIQRSKVSEPDIPALKRLQFYFPKAYDALTGDDLKKRQQFENEESAREKK